MTAFSERTEGSGRRYLWTDAFAVCNHLTLADATRDGRWLERALALVREVHHTLGRHRGDDRRVGWLSAGSEADGEAHPTRGGLRIGKALPERGPTEPFDEHAEWERDGQYFHYLTKWMHALDQTSRWTGRPELNVWARELAEAAHRAFVYGTAGHRRLYWKMSIDLSRPLVGSMGQHDALDGLITCTQLEKTALGLPAGGGGPALKSAITDLATMVHNQVRASADPLGIGGLLVDAYRVEQLGESAPFGGIALRDALLGAALDGLVEYLRLGDLRRHASRRLAFRELGLAIGLRAISMMEAGSQSAGGRAPDHGRTRELLQALVRYLPIVDAIESFWLEPTNREAIARSDHRDIDEVMLATCLVPDGYLVLRSM